MIRLSRAAALVVAVVLPLVLATAASARTFIHTRDPIFSCFFAGTTTNCNLFVATSPEDISGSHRVALWGIQIPPSAQSAFEKYVQKELGGNLLHVRIKKRLHDKSIPAMLGEVMIVQGSNYVNFNKALLRDGYAQMIPGSPASYRVFQAYARRKGLGCWTPHGRRPVWIVPQPPKQDPAATGLVTDRDKTIDKYGIPSYSNRTLIPDNYSILQYHLYITDFYLNLGRVFIYRDGKLVNKQPTGQ